MIPFWIPLSPSRFTLMVGTESADVPALPEAVCEPVPASKSRARKSGNVNDGVGGVGGQLGPSGDPVLGAVLGLAQPCGHLSPQRR